MGTKNPESCLKEAAGMTVIQICILTIFSYSTSTVTDFASQHASLLGIPGWGICACACGVEGWGVGGGWVDLVES